MLRWLPSRRSRPISWTEVFMKNLDVLNAAVSVTNHSYEDVAPLSSRLRPIELSPVFVLLNGSPFMRQKRTALRVRVTHAFGIPHSWHANFGPTIFDHFDRLGRPAIQTPKDSPCIKPWET